MDHQDDHNARKKRTRSSEDPTLDKKIKHIKKQDQQNCHNNNNIDTKTHNHYNNNNNMSSQQQDHINDTHVTGQHGVFDFPWLKDGGGVARSDEWKLEDAFVSQLGESSSLFPTSPGAIELSFPAGHCLVPLRTNSLSPDDTFFERKFDDEEHELCPHSPLEDIGFETAESLDFIWSAFA